MSLLLPRIGVTGCSRAEALIANHPDSIVGTFWVMSGYGFDSTPIPDWWTDIVLEDNQAQAILNAYQEGAFNENDGNSLYLGFCIIVAVDKGNPANISYVIQHLRMFEGVGLLRILAKHNISAHTEVCYPMDFLKVRYGYDEESIPKALKEIGRWSVQVWEDYCSYLMAECGQKMTARFWAGRRDVD